MHITFHSFPVEHATQNTSTQVSIIGDLPQRGAPSFFCFLALCPRARRAGRQREEVLEQAAAFEANEGLTEGALPKEPGLHVMSRPGASKQAASGACGRKGRARREEPRNRDGWVGAWAMTWIPKLGFGRSVWLVFGVSGTFLQRGQARAEPLAGSFMLIPIFACWLHKSVDFARNML